MVLNEVKNKKGKLCKENKCKKLGVKSTEKKRKESNIKVNT